MSPDVRNLLLVVGVGATIGVLAVPPRNNVGAPSAGPGTTQISDGLPDQQLTEQQAQQRARAEALRQQQLIASAPQETSATARELRDAAIARVLANNPSISDLAALGPILNGGGSTPNNPYPGYSQPSYSAIPQLPIRSDAIGARASLSADYGSPRQSQVAPPVVPQLDFGPPVLNRAGPRTYSDSNGDFYTQAGPRGVINTRTGEFRSTN